MDKGSSVDKGSSMDKGSSVDKGSWSISSVVGKSSGSVDSGGVLLSVMISINSLRSSVGLAHDGSNFTEVGLEHGGRDGRGVTDLDGLVVGLVSRSNGEQSSADKCLHVVGLVGCDQLL